MVKKDAGVKAYSSSNIPFARLPGDAFLLVCLFTCLGLAIVDWRGSGALRFGA